MTGECGIAMSLYSKLIIKEVGFVSATLAMTKLTHLSLQGACDEAIRKTLKTFQTQNPPNPKTNQKT